MIFSFLKEIKLAKRRHLFCYFFLLSSNGSIIVSYNVTTSLRNKSESGLNTLKDQIYKAATVWENQETILGGEIDQSRTNKSVEKTNFGRSTLCLNSLKMRDE